MIFSFHLKEELLKNNSIKIFIIDAEVETKFLKSPVLKIQPNSSHGSKVAAVIRSQSRAEINAFSAENIIGRIDKDNYLTALKNIKNYALVNPEEKIIVNISLGFEERDFQKEIIKEIKGLENIVLVAAAGNNNREQVSYPARFEKVIAVAALENEEKMAGSNYGREIDFAASGIIEITQRHYLPALNYSRKYKLSGTSFAAPQITALIADLLALKPELTIEEALKIIKETSQGLSTQIFKEGKLGAGRIDRFRALTKANSYYFWLQLALYISLISAALLFLYLCWQKYSLSGIFIFFIISTVLFLMQPLLLVLYYQFGFIKLIFFLAASLLIYYFSLKLISVYLSQSNNLKLLLKLTPYLNQNLSKKGTARIIKILNQKNNEQQKDYHKTIKNSLNKCSSKKRCSIYLKVAAQLNRPPLFLIIKKSINFNLKAEIIAKNLIKKTPGQKEKLIINAELLDLIISEAYKVKKKTVAVASELADPLILVPVKNLLLKRKQYRLNSQTQYFLLDLLGSAGIEAADFSTILADIILKSSDPWLKYHALLAYKKIAVNQNNYQEFIKKIKAREKEPVLLALED